MVLFCCVLLLSVTLYWIISFLTQSVGPSASYYCVAEVIPSYSTFRQNGRKRKISIQSLNHQGSTLHTHAEKEEAILQCASSYGASLLECSGKVLGSGTRSECGDGQMEDWWKMELANLPKQVRRTKAAILTYTAWNICKARNRKKHETREEEDREETVSSRRGRVTEPTTGHRTDHRPWRKPR